MTTHVHIDRIVLDGVAPGAGGVARLKAAIEQELARLLAAQDGAAPLPGGARHSVDGGTLDLAGTPAASELGRRIARATFDSLRRDGLPNEFVTKTPGQGASPTTVRAYGEAVQRSHGDFFHERDPARGKP